MTRAFPHKPPLPAPCSASEFLLPVGRFSLHPRGNFSTVPAQPRREVPGGVCETGEGNRVGRTGPSLELPEHPHMGPSLRRDGLIGMVTSLPGLPVLPVPHPGATLHVTPCDPCPPWEFLPRQGFSMTPHNPLHILGQWPGCCIPPCPATAHRVPVTLGDAPAPHGCFQPPRVLLAPQGDAPGPHRCSWHMKGMHPSPSSRMFRSLNGIFHPPRMFLVS